MTDDILARARAALDGVTPGPWETQCYPWPTQIGCCPLVGNPRSAHHKMRNVAAANTDQDIRFIAAARSLVPEMADEIARLRAEVERLREAERTAWIAGRDAAAEVVKACALALPQMAAVETKALRVMDVAEFLDGMSIAILALTPEARHD
jgi:uncharacterized small protein (DUF1192 family)